MRFVGDRRGQSVVIGSIVLFGFLIIALSVYQAQVVPQENADVEFEHSQSVEGDFVDLRNSITSAGSTGDGRSTSVQLGTRYPQRTFFVNPPPATGQLSTSDPGEVRIEGASVDAEGNVGDYWDENPLAFDTRSVRYSPNYNEFRNGPDLLYEHSLVAAEFDDAVLARTGQTAVRDDGNRLSLTMIDGDLSASSVERRSFDPETLSQQRRTVTLEPEGGTVTLVLPTTVETEAKREALAEEWADEIAGDVTTSAEGDTIRVVIETDDPVRLGLSQVGVGSGTSATDESDGYITKVSQRDGIATAEVRDRYNNPVEEAEVEIRVDGVGETTKTDENGRVVYEAAGSPEDVRMSINDDEEEWEGVEFDDLGAGIDGSGEGTEQSGVGQGGDSTWSEEDSTETVSSSGGVWSGIDNVNAIVLSDPRLSPIGPSGDAESESRYFRLAFVVGDPPSGDTRYTFVFPRGPDDLEFEYDNGAFRYTDDVPVVVFKESPNGVSTLIEAEINNDALSALYQDGEELNLLDETVYTDPNEVRDEVEEIREHLFQNEGQEAFITDMTGRVDMTLEQRQYDGGQSESVSYNDDGDIFNGQSSGIEFSVRNNGDDPIGISSIAVEDTTSADAEVVTESNGGDGPGQREIYVSSPNGDGYYEAGDGGNDDYPIGNVVELTSMVSVESGSDAEITVTYFEDGSAGGSSERIDMRGEDVTVTLYFSDGTRTTFVVSIPE